MEPTMPSILTVHCCFSTRQYAHTYPSVAKQRDRAAKLRCWWVQHNQVHWGLQIAASSLWHSKVKANILPFSSSLPPSHERTTALPHLSASTPSLLIPHLTCVFFHRLFPTCPTTAHFYLWPSFHLISTLHLWRVMCTMCLQTAFIEHLNLYNQFSPQAFPSFHNLLSSTYCEHHKYTRFRNPFVSLPTFEYSGRGLVPWEYSASNPVLCLQWIVMHTYTYICMYARIGCFRYAPKHHCLLMFCTVVSPLMAYCALGPSVSRTWSIYHKYCDRLWWGIC